MFDITENQKLRLKFEPYKNNKFLFFISEINIRNTMIPFFAILGAKKLSFMKNKEEIIYEICENIWESRKNRYSLCIMTYHHNDEGKSAYIASLLQSIKRKCDKRDDIAPFLVYANSDESLEIQFGKNAKTRASNIRAAAKHGLKGLIIGNLDDINTSKKFVDKIIEIVEDDELAKMSTFERYLRKLVNRAYAYLNKIFGSEEEKEENISKAISLFEEVLQKSKDNYEALFGKAVACSSSSDPEKISDGIELFAKLEIVGEDMERVYEGHAGACYKMAEIVEDKSMQDKWLMKGVSSLNSLVQWQLSEYREIKKVQNDYHDPELMRQLSNNYSAIATAMADMGGKHETASIDYFLKGIEFDPKVASNYQAIPLMEKQAKKTYDFMKIVKACATARENLPGQEVEFLFKEAEAYFNAGKQHDATNLYNSVDKYIANDQIESWVQDNKKGITPDKKNADRIASFITFLNHRAIYFRKVGNHERSLDDLITAISLDAEKRYFDIYFNIAKAIISFLNNENTQSNYTEEKALNYLFTSIEIAINDNLETYENLLKSVKNDSIINPYIDEVRNFLNESNYSIPMFFK